MSLLSYIRWTKDPSRPSSETDVSKFLLDATLDYSVFLAWNQYINEVIKLIATQWSSYAYICDALRNLVPFLQFKQREKHPWSSVTFS